MGSFYQHSAFSLLMSEEGLTENELEAALFPLCWNVILFKVSGCLMQGSSTGDDRTGAAGKAGESSISLLSLHDTSLYLT